VSQENVEVVLGLLPAPNVDFAEFFRNVDQLAAFTEELKDVVHPGFENVRPGLLGGGKTYVGIDGMTDAWLDWLAPWATYRIEIEKALDLGDRVLVLTHGLGRPKGSEHEVKTTAATLWTFREGKIARVENYADRAEALKAVGLEE
jgi:ketosteroid isomerase-like protein